MHGRACKRSTYWKNFIDYVIQFARKNGFYNVTLNVWADNKNALLFYEKLELKTQKICMEKIL